MVEWLENNHEWVFILVLLWVFVNFFRTIRNKYWAKKKKELISQDTSSIGDLIGANPGHAKPTSYGGGSGGGAGSTRSFVPVNSANPTAISDLNNINGMAAISGAANTAPAEGLTDIVSQTSTMELTANAPDADLISAVAETDIDTTVEVVVETVVEVAGEIVAGVLKG